jgi:DNA-directed RNA polymerase subunit H (RpoH/RPB5)
MATGMIIAAATIKMIRIINHIFKIFCKKCIFNLKILKSKTKMDSVSYETLFRVKKESLILLKDRGFTIPSEEASILNGTMNIDTFINMYNAIKNDDTHPLREFIYKKSFRTAMTNTYNRGRETCFVYFADTENSKNKKKEISKQEVSVFCKAIADLEVNEAIMISNVPSSPAVEALSMNICDKTDNRNVGVTVQYFTYEELMFNPLNHIYVPKHRILSSKEAEELARRDKITGGMLPQILLFDPICKRLGARPGNIIEVTRKVLIEQSLIEEEISYRYVFAQPSGDRARK